MCFCIQTAQKEERAGSQNPSSAYSYMCVFVCSRLCSFVSMQAMHIMADVLTHACVVLFISNDTESDQGSENRAE